MNERVPWQAWNDGTSRFRWFVARGAWGNEYHETSDGRLIRFASAAAADRRARELNALDGAS